MGATSLVKFMDQTRRNGSPLFWGRADLDGAPFRGPVVPMLESEEAEDRLVTTFDAQNRIFDLSRPEDNKAYLAVLDMCYNGWSQLVYVKRVVKVVRNRKTKKSRIKVEVYAEWVERYKQDGRPMHSQRPYIGRPNE
jgi:hypothetical protein